MEGPVAAGAVDNSYNNRVETSRIVLVHLHRTYILLHSHSRSGLDRLDHKGIDRTPSTALSLGQESRSAGLDRESNHQKQRVAGMLVELEIVLGQMVHVVIGVELQQVEVVELLEMRVVDLVWVAEEFQALGWEGAILLLVPLASYLDLG
jgi:hypothetical protein